MRRVARHRGASRPRGARACRPPRGRTPSLVRTAPAAGQGAERRRPRRSRSPSASRSSRASPSSRSPTRRGKQVTAGPRRARRRAPTTLVVPLRTLAEGWYLVYWRVISADGHPVRGAFTFAVGPNAGPAPQFVVPSISETAATPRLVIARWVVLLAAMAAIGLFVLRILIARRARPAALGDDRLWGSRSASRSSRAPVYAAAVDGAVLAALGLRPRRAPAAVRRLAFGRGYLTLRAVPAAVRARGGRSRLARPARAARAARSRRCSP